MSETVQQALAWAVSELSELVNEKFDTARLDAEILLGFTLNQNRTWLKTWPEKALMPSELDSFKQLVERRKAKEPVAYIVGYQDFWTFRLKVTPATLIPRPETEHLVEFALNQIPLSEPCRVADLGTGTGAIALAIASERPQATVIATDISREALEVAEGNRQQLNLQNVSCQQGHWLREWSGEPFDLVVSNPPYVDEDDAHLRDLAYEPLSALVAADNGLADIAEIAQQAKHHLKINGWLVIEHGYQQGEAVRHLFRQHGFEQVNTLHDYAGLPRVTFGRNGCANRIRAGS